MFKKGLLFILFAAIAASPAVGADIEGSVRSGSRSGELVSATVQLVRNNFILEEHLAGGNGRFEFRNLNIGNYTVRIHAEGFRDNEVPIMLARTNSREVLQLELVPVQQRSDTGVSWVVSVYDFQIPAAARREYEQGLKDREKGGCAKAIPNFEKAVAAFSRYAEAQNELGKCFQESRRLTEAEEAFRASIKYGTSIFPYINLADLYAVSNRPEAAQSLLGEAITKYPDEGDLRFALAKSLFDQGKLKDAEGAGLAAHSRFHRSADVHLLLAKVYLAAQNFPAVVEQLKLYLQENPKGPLADRVRQNLAEIEGR